MNDKKKPEAMIEMPAQSPIRLKFKGYCEAWDIEQGMLSDAEFISLMQCFYMDQIAATLMEMLRKSKPVVIDPRRMG